MLSFDEALARVLASAPRLPSETVALRDALGRVLAEPVVAVRALPPFDYSAMDGYAVSVGAFTGDGPWRWRVVGESRTGQAAPVLESGTVCRIFTGAPIPSGADAVVMQEDVTREGDIAMFRERPPPGDNIRSAGEDLAARAVALEAGARVGPFQLGLIAACDQAHVRVATCPRVFVVCTGDELREPGSPDRPGSIPESNGYVIAALARASGAAVRVAPRTGDDPDATRRIIEEGLRTADVLVTIGGVSVGDHDVVRPALEAAGAELGFWKVAIKPGKPLVLGRAGSTVVLGLPGNPASAQITFALFGLPLLRSMQGDRRAVRPPRPMTLAADITQRPGRRGFYRATIAGSEVTPLSGQSSGASTSMAWADALIVLPETSTGARRGDSVAVYELEAL